MRSSPLKPILLLMLIFTASVCLQAQIATSDVYRTLSEGETAKDRRAFLGRLGAAAQADIWREHLTLALTRYTLTNEQRAGIIELIASISRDHYLPGAQAANAQNKSLKDLENRLDVLFTDPELRIGIFVIPGTPSSKIGCPKLTLLSSDAPTDGSICNCSVGSSFNMSCYYGTNSCCQYPTHSCSFCYAPSPVDNTCGFMGRYDCDGWCWYGPGQADRPAIGKKGGQR